MSDFRQELKRHVDCYLFERLQITDEFDISIQGGEYSYSSPRETLEDATEYTMFELGFPNFIPPDYILSYAEDSRDPKGTVYGYVPVELIQKMVDELRGDL